MPESHASTLCKACGLCCTGYLFVWVRLNARELDPVQSLGLNVIRDDPRQRGFTQPCPVWQGECAVYTSPHYPRSCRSYNCQLLKELIDENITLPQSLEVIEQAKKMIKEVESMLPASPTKNFRERLVAYMQHLEEAKIPPQASELLAFYEKHFGVKDLFD